MYLQKKEYEKKKRMIKLQNQMKKCLDDDRLANDEERIRYEESIFRMQEAMDILKSNERSSVISKYIRDWKIVCQNEKKLSTHQKIANKNDLYFKDS